MPLREWRNIMVHEYFGAHLGIVWQTLQTDLPPLVRELRGILEPER
ncbi:MAG TPA: HepT-like ribonuclease domain-containing protein [Planctomycetota bacterium]|nr:HepT-like ribonuclease domain-containing protein [Planctomycetota bacterium]